MSVSVSCAREKITSMKTNASSELPIHGCHSGANAYTTAPATSASSGRSLAGRAATGGGGEQKEGVGYSVFEVTVEPSQLSWIANFIWGIADDVLRDLYVRGKYRDVILPMTVLRRLDAVLEPTKRAVLDMKASLDKAQIVHQDQALRQAAGQAFYNTSKFTLRDLKARASQQQLKADFEAYLDGFSPNVQDILENFEFRNQIPRLSKADALGTLIESSSARPST